MRTAPLQMHEVEGLFQGQGKTPVTALSYRISVALVAIGWVILVACYLALIGATAYGAYWYWVHFPTAPRRTSARGTFGFYLLACTPLVGCLILLFFLFKPLLARASKPPGGVVLDPKDEPVLHALVAKLARVMKAPEPVRIETNLEVNASASFDGGWSGMLSRRLVLTIGVPLIQGFSARELVAVIAHELGHFAQGGGMAFYYLSASISHWFARIVYERDAWDERLVRWSQESDWRIAILLWVARAAIWLTRKILLGLMTVGNLMSSWLSRQMEFDADHNAAIAAGHSSLSSALQGLYVIEAASSMTHQSASQLWESKKLCSNWASLLAHHHRNLTDSDRQEIMTSADKHPPTMYASHPPTAARIEALTNTGERGVFQLEAAATVLFRDFDSAAERITKDTYATWFGPTLAEAEILSAETAISSVQQQKDRDDRMTRFFGPFLYLVEYRRLAGWLVSAPISDLSSAKAELAQVREREQDHHQRLTPQSEELGKTFELWLTHRRAQSLVQAGFRIDAAAFGLTSTSPASIEQARNSDWQLFLQKRSTMDQDNQDTRRKLALSLALAEQTTVVGQVRELCETLIGLDDAVELILELQGAYSDLDALLANHEAGASMESYVTELLVVAGTLDRQLESLQAALGQVAGLTAEELATVRPFGAPTTIEQLDLGRSIDATVLALGGFRRMKFERLALLVVYSERGYEELP